MARPKKGQPSKTSFVLAHPASLSATEVVAKAKAAGVTLTEAYVYTIRSNAKRKKGPRKPGRPKGSGKGTNLGKGVGSLKDAEKQLLEWIIDHGAVAVERTLQNVTARIRQLAG